MARAALDLKLAPSALSQQISRLEGELCTRLLHRSASGVVPTEAGSAFFPEARLTLRHAEQAIRSARQARLTGTVSVGLAPTTSAMLGLPLMQAMRERYPDVRLHLVESLSGHLSTLLNTRELDLAVLFDVVRPPALSTESHRGWQVQPLLTEDLFLISVRRDGIPAPSTTTLDKLGEVPLILPTGPHGLRSAIDSAFERARLEPRIVLEVDSLSMVMAAVDAGLGSTLQPQAAIGRHPDGEQRFTLTRIDDPEVNRVSHLCSLPEDELTPSALATRIVIRDTAKALVDSGRWRGTRLSRHES